MNPWWKNIVNPLLIIINSIILGIFFLEVIIASKSDSGFGFILTIPLLFILTITDFIVVIKHIKKNNPDKINAQTGIIFIVISLVLVYTGVIVFRLFFPQIVHNMSYILTIHIPYLISALIH